MLKKAFWEREKNALNALEKIQGLRNNFKLKKISDLIS